MICLLLLLLLLLLLAEASRLCPLQLMLLLFAHEMLLVQLRLQLNLLKPMLCAGQFSLLFDYYTLLVASHLGFLFVGE